MEGDVVKTAAEALKKAIARASSGESLSRGEAREALQAILSGGATPAQIGGLLVALRMKGETAEEIAGFAEAMRAAAVAVKPRRQDLIDLCGTGGDASGSINLSTAASLVAAAAGAGVAKHGNRCASSQCGSADVLEALGVPIQLPPERSAALLDAAGFAFLFAPAYHPAMRHAAGPRRELGVRTVFNILGPISSPAAVRRQLIGVYEDRLRRRLAEVLRLLGSERVWVVHGPAPSGAGGLDELSIAGATRVTELRQGEIRDFEVIPEEAGLQRGRLEELRGGDAAHNAARLLAILSGERGAQREAVLLNAAAALVVAGLAESLRGGAERAAAAIDAGKTIKLLEELKRWA